MPRGEPRRLLNFRLSQSGHTWVNDLCVELEVDKTSVIRAAFAVAKTHEAELKAIIRERKHEA